MYRQGLPATISYPPRSHLPHGVGVGSPPSLSFFPRLPGSSLPHGVGVGSPPSLSLLEIPSQELVVSGRYLIISHKFFACLSESLGVESASHQQSLHVQFCMKLQEPSISCKEVNNYDWFKAPGVKELTRKAWPTTPHE